MFGLICNEFITIFTPGRGIFDWNDIVWTLMGGEAIFNHSQKNSKMYVLMISTFFRLDLIYHSEIKRNE